MPSCCRRCASIGPRSHEPRDRASMNMKAADTSLPSAPAAAGWREFLPPDQVVDARERWRSALRCAARRAGHRAAVPLARARRGRLAGGAHRCQCRARVRGPGRPARAAVGGDRRQHDLGAGGHPVRVGLWQRRVGAGPGGGPRDHADVCVALPASARRRMRPGGHARRRGRPALRAAAGALELCPAGGGRHCLQPCPQPPLSAAGLAPSPSRRGTARSPMRTSTPCSSATTRCST